MTTKIAISKYQLNKSAQNLPPVNEEYFDYKLSLVQSDINLDSRLIYGAMEIQHDSKLLSFHEDSIVFFIVSILQSIEHISDKESQSRFANSSIPGQGLNIKINSSGIVSLTKDDIVIELTFSLFTESFLDETGVFLIWLSTNTNDPDYQQLSKNYLPLVRSKVADFLHSF